MTRQLGVEEELLLIDPATGQPQALAGAVLNGAARRLGGDDESGGAVEAELQQEQVESATRPRRRLDDVAAEVRRYRQAAAGAAQEVGVELAALAVTPLSAEPTLTPGHGHVTQTRVVSVDNLTKTWSLAGSDHFISRERENQWRRGTWTPRRLP